MSKRRFFVLMLATACAHENGLPLPAGSTGRVAMPRSVTVEVSVDGVHTADMEVACSVALPDGSKASCGADITGADGRARLPLSDGTRLIALTVAKSGIEPIVRWVELPETGTSEALNPVVVVDMSRLSRVERESGHDRSTNATAPVRGEPPYAVQDSSGLESSLASAQKEAGAAIQECASKKRAKKLRTWVATAQCYSPLVREAYTRISYPDLDLIDLFLAYSVAIAERVDKRQISEAEANAQTMELLSRIQTESQTRALARYNAALAESAARAQAAQVEQAQALARAQAEATARAQARAATQVQAQRMQAYGALAQGLGAWNASMQPPPRPGVVWINRPGMVICQPTGGGQFQCF